MIGSGIAPRYARRPKALPLWVPVAMLPDDLVTGPGFKIRMVHMTDASAAKQLHRHPELDASDYARFADMLGDARAVRSGERYIVLVSREGDVPWIAVLKAAQDGVEVFLVTFYRAASSRYGRRILARGEMLREWFAPGGTSHPPRLKTGLTGKLAQAHPLNRGAIRQNQLPSVNRGCHLGRNTARERR